MRTLILILIVFSFSGLRGQSAWDTTRKAETYVSKKKVYQIQYNAKQWRVANDSTSDWDIEFQDTYGLLSAYFSEFSYFIPENKLKQTITSQFKDVGKIKNLKIYKKQLRHVTVDYFECELKYKGYLYKYQGFVYTNGRSGSVELQFSGEQQSIKLLQGLIDEFCDGFTEIK